jgi:hypothetical protein
VPALNPTVKNLKKLKEVSSSAALLKAVEVTEIFTTGGTGICTCCKIQASTLSVVLP